MYPLLSVVVKWLDTLKASLRNFLLTLGAHAQQGYGTRSVCLSVKLHLTSGVSIRPENSVTYSTGNEGKKIVGISLKPLRCRDTLVPTL